MDPRDVLDAIRQRAEKATDGPWETRESVDGYSSSVWGPRGCVAAMRSTPAREMSRDEFGPLRRGRRREDAEFIATARTDVSRLVAALTAVLVAHPEAEATIAEALGDE